MQSLLLGQLNRVRSCRHRDVYGCLDLNVLGKVVLATFRAQGNLNREGHNLYSATADSGEAVIGDADTGGRGSVHSFTLEGSNIDLEREFVSLIKSQKGYQASARLVSSVDDLLQELMQIV